MKHLKSFETLNNNKPQINDYVLCEETLLDEISTKFISENIGLIISYTPESNTSKEHYIVEYDNVTPDLSINSTRAMFKSEIKYWSKNIKDIETILNIKKYNL